METVDFSKPLEFVAVGPNGPQLFRVDCLKLSIHSFYTKTGKAFWYASPYDKPNYVVDMSSLRNVD